MIVIDNINDLKTLTDVKTLLLKFDKLKIEVIEDLCNAIKNEILSDEKSFYKTFIALREPFLIGSFNSFDKMKYEKENGNYIKIINGSDVTEEILNKEFEKHNRIENIIKTLRDYNLSEKKKIDFLLSQSKEDLNINMSSEFYYPNNITFQTYYLNERIFYALIRSGKIDINAKNNLNNYNLFNSFIKDNYTFSVSLKMLMLGSDTECFWNPLNHIRKKEKYDHLITFGINPLLKDKSDSYGIPAEYHYWNHGKKEITPFIKSLLKDPRVAEYLLNGNGKDNFINKNIMIDIIEDKFKGKEKYLLEMEKYINFLDNKMEKYLLKESKYFKQLGITKNPHEKIWLEVKKQMQLSLNNLIDMF